jgi:hypothetical protein
VRQRFLAVAALKRSLTSPMVLSANWRGRKRKGLRTGGLGGRSAKPFRPSGPLRP